MFNKIRTFPEYHDSNSSIMENRKQEQNILDQTKLAFGADFDQFIKSQPEPLKDPLTGVNQNGNVLAAAIEEFHSIGAALPADFHVFLDYYNEKKQKLSETEAIEKQANKAEDNANAAEQKAAKSREKGAPDTAKFEQLAEQARSAATEARQNATTAREAFNQYNTEYTAKFTESFVTMMDAFLSKRASALRQYVNIGNELSNAVLGFHEFTDPTITNLEQRLDNYKKVEV